MSDDDVRSVLLHYPQIYLACHARHVRGKSAPSGLSERDANLLGHLDVRAPTSPTALAKHLGVTPSTMSAWLAELEAKGALVLRRRAEDRRRVDVLLTPAGARAILASSVLDARRVRAVLDRLAGAERAAALRGLEILARSSREMMTAWSGDRAWVARRKSRAARPAIRKGASQ
jgi:MarR family transcriptional regulator, organic hydroperoxide resistance regulator